MASDLDPAHVEAVARALAHPERVSDRYREQAHRLLTRDDDHLTHAALLATLVRAGVLTEEDRVDWCTQEEYHDDDYYWMRCGLPADHDGEHRNSDTGRRWERRPDIDPEDVPKPRERRYVTRWEDVDA